MNTMGLVNLVSDGQSGNIEWSVDCINSLTLKEIIMVEKNVKINHLYTVSGCMKWREYDEVELLGNIQKNKIIVMTCIYLD